MKSHNVKTLAFIHLIYMLWFCVQLGKYLVKNIAAHCSAVDISPSENCSLLI